MIEGSCLSCSELETLAETIRRQILVSIFHARSGHPGGSLSCVEILVAISEIEKRCGRVAFPRLILSKGHGCPALYALAVNLGVEAPADLLNLRKLGGKFQGHPSLSFTPWVGAGTGSLGQGFSIALGKALSFKYLASDLPVYAVLGDGELQEGQVWEAAMCAAHMGLGNLVVLIDYNKLQSDDRNENIIGLEPLKQKWDCFGWQVSEVDGHNLEELLHALVETSTDLERPSCIICNTIKGKGISFMEDKPAWHGSVCIKEEEISEALVELGVPNEAIADYIAGRMW